jgi:hypothetical protein
MHVFHDVNSCRGKEKSQNSAGKSKCEQSVKDYSSIKNSRMGKPRVIYWFRTDLRLHDSPALKAALDLSPEAFWPIWTWDPHYVYHARVGVNRWQFL